MPYQVNGQKAKNNDPKTWHSYEAVQAARKRFDGIGFCLMDSGFAAFDIDDCRNSETGEIHSWAEALVEKVGSYTEVTVSGSGLRIIGRASGPKVHRKLPVMDGVSCELYRRAERYIVMTGNALGDNGLADIDNAIDATLAELDCKKKKAPDSATAKGPRPLADGEDQPGATTPDTGESTGVDLSPGLTSMLSVRGPGGYLSRSELLFAFLTRALRERVAEDVIATACLDDRYEGSGIYEHCRENGGREYVGRQIANANEEIADGKASRLPPTRCLHFLLRISIPNRCGMWLPSANGTSGTAPDGELTTHLLPAIAHAVAAAQLPNATTQGFGSKSRVQERCTQSSI